MTTKATPQLEFSEKYDAEHARQYFHKHDDGFWRRISNSRDHHIAREALRIAGNPRVVLDIPCGTGRFWDVLSERPDRVIHACDYSQNMIDVGMACRPDVITKRITAFQGSAFRIPVVDDFVDCVFCIRFIHHLGEQDDRLELLHELHRVTSDTVIISLWVDGSIKSWSRRRLEKKRKARSYQNRFIIPKKVIESEFAQCGFDIVAHLDFSRYISMWRTYVLRKKI
jgi:ubiquinone/menaquinone biosynthesis C-methylase UbiE